jgi:hypothetical protein
MANDGKNSIDKVVLDRWTGEVLAIHTKLDDQRMENMRICKEIRSPLNDLYEAAKNAGLPLKAFKAHIKAELAQKAFDKRMHNIEPEDEDDRAAYDLLRSMATDGDLFDAAVKQHDDDRDLRPRHLREADAQTAENVHRLQTGMEGLPGAEAAEA